MGKRLGVAFGASQIRARPLTALSYRLTGTTPKARFSATRSSPLVSSPTSSTAPLSSTRPSSPRSASSSKAPTPSCSTSTLEPTPSSLLPLPVSEEFAPDSDSLPRLSERSSVSSKLTLLVSVLDLSLLSSSTCVLFFIFLPPLAVADLTLPQSHSPSASTSRKSEPSSASRPAVVAVAAGSTWS